MTALNLIELPVYLPEDKETIIVRYERKPIPARLQQLASEINEDAPPVEDFVQWSRLYIEFVYEMVRWWDIVDDNGEMYPLTREGIEEIPYPILGEITHAIFRAEKIHQLNGLGPFPFINSA